MTEKTERPIEDYLIYKSTVKNGNHPYCSTDELMEADRVGLLRTLLDLTQVTIFFNNNYRRSRRLRLRKKR